MTSTAWGDPHYDSLTRAIAAHGLAGSTLELPTRPLPDDDFGRLLSSVRTQRLTGLLWAAIESEALPVTTAQQARAEWLHVGALAGVLALERLLLETATALEGAGIPLRVLKGPVLAHVDYPDSAWRTFGDVDLMVRSEDYDGAVAVLRGLGHERRHPEPRPGFDRRYGKGTSFLTGDGLELDLHRTFSLGPFGVRLALEDLWSCSESFRLAGHRLEALAVEERFVHACYHAILGDAQPRLVPLRDVAQLALTYSLDGERVHRLTRRSGGEAVIARAVQMAWHELEVADVLAISAWADNYRFGAQETADLEIYASGSSYARKSVAAVRALPSWPQKARFVHAMALPHRSYLGTRHSGRVDRLRHGLARPARRSDQS